MLTRGGNSSALMDTSRLTGKVISGLHWNWFILYPIIPNLETRYKNQEIETMNMAPCLSSESEEKRQAIRLFHGWLEDLTGQPSSGQSKKDNDRSEHYFGEFHIVVIMILVGRWSYSRSHKWYRPHERSVGYYKIIIVTLNFNNTWNWVALMNNSVFHFNLTRFYCLRVIQVSGYRAWLVLCSRQPGSRWPSRLVLARLPWYNIKLFGSRFPAARPARATDWLHI